jgi:hypothetical protein
MTCILVLTLSVPELHDFTVCRRRRYIESIAAPADDSPLNGAPVTDCGLCLNSIGSICFGPAPKSLSC